MSDGLFQEWVEGLNNEFLAQKRKVALVVDNCPSDLEVENLKAIKLVFLPPKTTSKTQPMDQGVIIFFSFFILKLFMHGSPVSHD